MNKVSSGTRNMKICDVYRKTNKEQNYQKSLKSPQHLFNSEQIKKIHCSFRIITLFPKAFEIRSQSDKHPVKTNQKIRCDKSQRIYDSSH